MYLYLYSSTFENPVLVLVLVLVIFSSTCTCTRVLLSSTRPMPGWLTSGFRHWSTAAWVWSNFKPACVFLVGWQQINRFKTGFLSWPVLRKPTTWLLKLLDRRHLIGRDDHFGQSDAQDQPPSLLSYCSLKLEYLGFMWKNNDLFGDPINIYVSQSVIMYCDRVIVTC